MTDEYRYTVCRQHAGTGFPMGAQYATGNRKEANAVAKALAGRAKPGVYFSVNDTAKSAARPRFFYLGKDGDPSLPLPEVVEVRLHCLTGDGRGAWVTMCYANGWAKRSLWPLEDGQVMQGWPMQDWYSLAPGVLDRLNRAIHAEQVEEPSDKPDMRLSDFMTLITEVIAAEVHCRGVSLSATDEIVTLGKQLRFCPPQSD